MKIVRNIFAVIIGYLIFAVSAVALFRFTAIDPHLESGISTKILVIACGIVFALIGGYVAKLIAASRTLTVNFVLAILMAAFAAFSAFKSDGEHYTQLAAVFLFAPASLMGGVARRRSEK